MRRSLILTTILAASVAVLGACDPKPEVPNKPPVATPSPAPTVNPVASPSVSPTGSPLKTGATPEVKKTDEKDVHKDVKPTSAETPKAK